MSSAFKVGNDLCRSDTLHANAVHYVLFDDSFTIADRNPSVIVKVSATGTLEWQVGGPCDDAPAGARCFPHQWQVIHGRHLLEDGRSPSQRFNPVRDSFTCVALCCRHRGGTKAAWRSNEHEDRRDGW